MLYAVGDRPDLRDALVVLLRNAQERLGSFAEFGKLYDPNSWSPTH